MSKSSNFKRQDNVESSSEASHSNKNKKEENNEEIKHLTATSDNNSPDKLKDTKTAEIINKINTYKIATVAALFFLLIIIIIITISLYGGKKAEVSSGSGKYATAYTSCGKVEGIMEDSSYTFRGIPYARPPLGDLRFKYAQPLDRLEYCWNDTFIAHNHTDLCLQILANGTLIGTEDCLTLDVVTPYVRYDNPLPVVVLIGAESLIGGSPGKLRPSARYARSRNIVFVRPNFRLGALGFLALDILAESDYPKTSGNYGLSDILAALKWVQLNIEHFGGNKNSVTIFGHRAGATLVTALTTIAGANKYFVRAWASSGGSIYPNKDVKAYESENLGFLDATHCKDVACLRTMDAEKLVSAVQDTWRKPHLDLPSQDEVPENRHQWLVLDGRILKSYPDEVWKSNNEPTLNLIIGTTAHSGSSEKLLLKHKNWTKELVEDHIMRSFVSATPHSEDIRKMYDLNYKGLSQMISDIRVVCPLFSITNKMHSVPFYVVTQTRFEEDIADIDSDVEAILGRYEPRTPEQRRYFSAMQGLFYHYVWNGKIEHNMIGQNVLIVEQDVLPNSSYSHCDYWILKNVVPKYAALD